MEIGYFNGAMYARLAYGEKLDKSPVGLGDGILNVGEYVQKLGEKSRTSFGMKDGWYLRYSGRYNEVLFFDTNTARPQSEYEWHYAFSYIDMNTLLVGGRHGARDIRITKLIKFEQVPIQETEDQMSFL